jgi:hypothetical protein
VTLKVSIMGRDPNGLREDLEGFLDGREAASQEDADRLLNEFLQTIDGRTTGADRLAIEFIPE